MARFVATSYGPPWGGIQGGGVTSTGVNLRKRRRARVVAVDPSVIPYHTRLRIWPNPFGDPNLVFQAEDTGGAIKGKRIDFFDPRGRSHQYGFGRKGVRVQVLGKGKPGHPPEGSQDGSGGAASPGSSLSVILRQGTGITAPTPPDLTAVNNLAQSLQPPAPPPLGQLPAPSFSAKAPMPAGAQPIPSAGPPQPPQSSLDEQLQAVSQIAGAQPPEQPQITLAGAVRGGQQAEAQQAGHYPLGKRGKIIGTPHTGTHTLGNWQSDEAVDIAVPVGTPVYAASTGVVTKAGPLEKSGSRFAGDRVQLDGVHNSFWYGHLSKLTVHAGQKVHRGQLIGYSGSANGVAHLHFAQQRGDPRRTVR